MEISERSDYVDFIWCLLRTEWLYEMKIKVCVCLCMYICIAKQTRLFPYIYILTDYMNWNILLVSKVLSEFASSREQQTFPLFLEEDNPFNMSPNYTLYLVIIEINSLVKQCITKKWEVSLPNMMWDGKGGRFSFAKLVYISNQGTDLLWQEKKIILQMPACFISRSSPSNQLQRQITKDSPWRFLNECNKCSNFNTANLSILTWRAMSNCTW